MFETFDAILKALVANDMLLIACLLASFFFGFLVGFKTCKILNKRPTTPLEPVRYEKLYGCLVPRADGTTDIMEVPVAFKDDDIIRIDCPFNVSGNFKRLNKRCLIYNNLT